MFSLPGFGNVEALELVPTMFPDLPVMFYDKNSGIMLNGDIWLGSLGYCSLIETNAEISVRPSGELPLYLIIIIVIASIALIGVSGFLIYRYNNFIRKSRGIKEKHISEIVKENKEELMKFYIKAQIRIRDKIYT